jgi:hypothetical protein
MLGNLTEFQLLFEEHRHDRTDHHSDLRHQAICLANRNLAGARAPSHQPLPRGGDRAPRASRRARSPAQARRPPSPGYRHVPLADRQQSRRAGADARANAAARLALTGSAAPSPTSLPPCWPADCVRARDGQGAIPGRVRRAGLGRGSRAGTRRAVEPGEQKRPAAPALEMISY